MEIKNNGWNTIAGIEKLAIVGMNVCLGIGQSLAAFEQAIFTGVQQTRLPEEGLIRYEDIEPDFWGLAGYAGGLSKEDKLLLRVSQRALHDAGLAGGAVSSKVAFLFSRGSEFAALSARRLTDDPISDPSESDQMESFEHLWNFSGQVFNLSEAGNPLTAGLVEADRLLSTSSVEVVLLASCVLGEDFSWLAENSVGKMNAGSLAIGFERSCEGWTLGEGACALAIMRPKTAAAQGKRIYAVIDALASTVKDGIDPKKNPFPTFLSSETILRSCQQAMADAKTDPARIGYLEVLGSGYTPVDTAEITGITRAYRSGGSGLTCAVGSIQANTGYLFPAAGLAALIKTTICLYNRMIPAVPQWGGPKKPELWVDTPFYVASESRTWFLAAGEIERTAAVNSIGWDGSCVHIIIREEAQAKSRTNGFLQQSPFYLFPIGGDTQAELLQGLDLLQQKAQRTTDLRPVAKWNFEAFQNKTQAAFALAVVGHDPNELQKEIELAWKSLPRAMDQKKSWQTPQGSFFTGEPVGRQGGVAFVYPGAFNSYLGLGREIFLLFPQLYEQVTRLTANLGATIQERQLYPRNLDGLCKAELVALETTLNADPIAMITSGSLMAVVFTMILRDIFKVQPEAAFGYSLGEIAMLFGMGVWKEADGIRAQLSSSPLFRTRLSGPQNAVRDCWGLQPVEIASGKPLWSNYFLMSAVEKVAEAVEQEERVYLTHINTPRQVVIGGDPESCQRVINRIQCNSLKAPFDFALHCEAMRSEYGALVDLHTWQVASMPETRLYSAADNRPLPMDNHRIAQNISSMLCSCLDFPGLIRQAYADGVRVFIELGANSNCSKWIDDTLKGHPSVAIPINRRGADDQASIVRMLAKLASHRVPVDLSALY